MQLRVERTDEGHRLCRAGGDVELVNQFLAHPGVRCFSPATVRAYSYDLLNFLRFLSVRRATLADVVPTDLFDLPGLAAASSGDGRGAGGAAG